MPLSSDLLYSYHRESKSEYLIWVLWSMEKMVCKQPHLLAIAVIQVLEGTAPDSSFPWYVREISQKSSFLRKIYKVKTVGWLGNVVTLYS